MNSPAKVRRIAKMKEGRSETPIRFMTLSNRSFRHLFSRVDSASVLDLGRSALIHPLSIAFLRGLP